MLKTYRHPLRRISLSRSSGGRGAVQQPVLANVLHSNTSNTNKHIIPTSALPYFCPHPQCPRIMDPFDALLKLVDQLRNDQPSDLQRTCQQILDHPQTSFGLRAIASDLLVRWECRKGVSQICTDEDLLILDQRMDKIRTEFQGKDQCVCLNRVQLC